MLPHVLGIGRSQERTAGSNTRRSHKPRVAYQAGDALRIAGYAPRPAGRRRPRVRGHVPADFDAVAAGTRFDAAAAETNVKVRR